MMSYVLRIYLLNNLFFMNKWDFIIFYALPFRFVFVLSQTDKH